MPVFYHCDRANDLKPNTTLNLYQPTVKDDDLHQFYFDLVFPNGVTRHGDNYFFRTCHAQDPNYVRSRRIELIFEKVRRIRAPNRPSRAMSVFGVLSLEDAEAFLRLVKEPGSERQASVWKVEAEQAFVTNMKLLHAYSSRAWTERLAEEYWAGSVGPSEFGPPLWEVLMVPPVRVLEKVDRIMSGQ